ncbi:MAG: neutral/alkaline non-lysosomal ceramidase N-terminal domain-containing protein [Planctomycetaceae bacterium]|nr:neutral/alkaline non-lysosomal ceramidase N-terminal domain-containing protein [Planctomycetaceae bacterium]
MRTLWFVWLLVIVAVGSLTEAAEPLAIGVAKRDITPQTPVRMTGYSSRANESEGVEQRLWAKALALGTGDQTVVWITLDSLGIAADQTEELAAKLKQRFGLPRERLVICASHTHTGPFVRGVGNLIYPPPLPPEHVAHSERYRRELSEHLEAVAIAALEDRRPGRLAWSQGKVGFAINRRVLKDGKWTGFGSVPAGAVDHALPVLRATDEQGKVRAVLVNYACHCTTLGPRFNKICGDWAGYAQEYLERDHPGAIGMIAIGCGADANPEPRDKGDAIELCKQHGAAIAAEVQRLQTGTWQTIDTLPVCKLETIALPFDTQPTHEEYAARAKEQPTRPIGWHARVQLKRLDRGEKLPTTLAYPVHTWQFGTQLTTVFLAGEVVVDYALRLKQELNNDRLWLTAYANDDPCYIASRRILLEGGYEADSSMYYYDRPTRFAPAVEDLIVTTVKKQLQK